MPVALSQAFNQDHVTSNSHVNITEQINMDNNLRNQEYVKIQTRSRSDMMIELLSDPVSREQLKQILLSDGGISQVGGAMKTQLTLESILIIAIIVYVISKVLR